MAEKQCCEAMDKALEDGYLAVRLTFDREKHALVTLPPVIPGPLLKPRGRKHRPPFIINICPWCGYKFPDV